MEPLGTPAACNTSWMPVWWYPFSSIRWSPASTRVALVGALGLERASALACSAMCYLRHPRLIHVLIPPVRCRLEYRHLLAPQRGLPRQHAPLLLPGRIGIKGE